MGIGREVHHVAIGIGAVEGRLDVLGGLGGVIDHALDDVFLVVEVIVIAANESDLEVNEGLELVVIGIVGAVLAAARIIARHVRRCTSDLDVIHGG